MWCMSDDDDDDGDDDGSSLLLHQMQQLGEPPNDMYGLQPRFAAVGDGGDRGDEYV